MRNPVFANGEIYHVYNRSIEQKPVFTDKKECLRATITLDYYRFQSLSFKLSKALILNLDERKNYFSNLKNHKKIVEILAYCLMPNHFHFLIKQESKNGIKKYISDFSNSYVRYFNTKRERTGPLFQGAFKAIRIESDEQLIHVSRYIHLNPATSFLIKENELDSYPWTSLPEYLGITESFICNKEPVLNLFPSIKAYRKFVHDQISYARELDSIKHLTLE